MKMCCEISGRKSRVYSLTCSVSQRCCQTCNICCLSSDFNVDFGNRRNICCKVKWSSADVASPFASSFPIIPECPFTQLKKNDFSEDWRSKVISRTRWLFLSNFKRALDLINYPMKLSRGSQSILQPIESPPSQQRASPGRPSSPDRAYRTRKKCEKQIYCSAVYCCHCSSFRFRPVFKNVCWTLKVICWANANSFW